MNDEKNVRGEMKDGKLIIYLAGNINSTNAPEVESEINVIRDKNPEGSLIIDAEKLVYISSAGLRIILRLSQKSADLKIINVSTDVYEVFEMTGFTEMLSIEKAYRHLSVDGCEIIGQGANGVVYRLDPDTIIKVYRNPDALPDIKRERELAHKAFVLGIPTAIPYDVVKVGNGYGSVFELLSAQSFAKLLVKYPENFDTYIKLYVDLLKKIHATTVQPSDMPDMKKVAVDWSLFLKDYLPQDKWEKLTSLIRNVPERMTMIHGDYHIKNVMMQGNEVLLIDMDTLSYGHPIFEFASMYLAYVGFGELNHDHLKEFLGVDFETAGKFWRESLKLYFGTTDESVVDKVEDKARIIGYTRLMRRTIRRTGFDDPDSLKLINHCKEQLIDLLDKVDSLDF